MLFHHIISRVCAFMLSCLVVSNSFATPWTIAFQVLLCMGFRRQEYWNGLPFPSPEDVPDPGIEPTSPALADRFFTTETSQKHHIKGVCVCVCVCVLFTQSCPTLCNPMDCSLPGFSVHGILQARLLEWIAIPFSRGFS